VSLASRYQCISQVLFYSKPYLDGLKIAAATVPKFSAGASFKAAVNKKK